MSTTLACVLLGCFDVMSEPTWPHSGTIVTKALAPDQAAEAVLTASKERGRYLFEIRESESGDTLAYSGPFRSLILVLNRSSILKHSDH